MEDSFENELLKTIEEVIKSCLGTLNAQLIFQYMEKNGCPKQEIPHKLDLFTETLDNLVGRGRGQFLGASAILQNTILKEMCRKMGVEYSKIGAGYFPAQCGKLREMYLKTEKQLVY
jgi:hypothetical protein